MRGRILQTIIGGNFIEIKGEGGRKISFNFDLTDLRRLKTMKTLLQKKTRIGVILYSWFHQGFQPSRHKMFFKRFFMVDNWLSIKTFLAAVILT